MDEFNSSAKKAQAQVTLDARGRPLNTIQRMAKDVHSNIMGIAANIEAQQPKHQPQTQQQWFSKDQGEQALKEIKAEKKRIQDDSHVAGAVKNERDAERAKMIADMKKKAKKGKQPSFEILDVTPEERAKGEKVAEYQARK